MFFYPVVVYARDRLVQCSSFQFKSDFADISSKARKCVEALLERVVFLTHLAFAPVTIDQGVYPVSLSLSLWTPTKDYIIQFALLFLR